MPAARTPGSFRREQALAALGTEAFDVLVIGGGITGVGVALDAASRGLRTALVEKGDFASGTSSKSSKMVHGGLRYLQQREFRLVYENLAERQRLLDNAPHLVSPLPFLIPLFGRDGVASKTVARSYSTALWLYDLTGGLRIGSRHHRVSKQQALEHLPLLNVDHLVAGFVYFDARADDARLTLEVLRTAVLDFGAVAANYVAAEALVDNAAGQVNGARVREHDPLTGAPKAGAPSIEISAKVVVNATGVWADDVRALDEDVHPHSIRPAKGVHITVPASRMPADIAAVIPVPKDRRSIFVVPWPEADLVYLGTTDTQYEGPLDDPACTPDDVDYLLDAVNGVTTAHLTRDDVTGVWAGLRPLLSPKSGGHHLSERTADLSRRHRVGRSAHGMISITGGKLTTYRKMAEETVDAALKLPALSQLSRRSVTKSLPIHGALPKGDIGLPAGTDPKLAAHLRSRYGTEAPDVLALTRDRPELGRPMIEGLPYLGAEFVYAARAEMAVTLDDLLSRRTRAAIQDARATIAAAPAIAELVAPELGWTSEQTAAETRSFVARTSAALQAAGLPNADVASLGEHS